jgi:hypothetical protein
MNTNLKTIAMKRLIVFTLLLLSSFPLNLNACGFYPWGEEVRFCYLKPRYFGYDLGYSYFNYTSDWYDYTGRKDTPDGEYDFSFDAGSNDAGPNVTLWQQYCDGKVDKQAIEQAVYKLPAKAINRNSRNAMLRYLYKTKNTEAIEYILFAKACEKLTWNQDPWEKDENKDAESTLNLFDKADKKITTLKDEQLKRRYLFLKMRLSYYYGDPKDKDAIYDNYFRNGKKDLIYYWALFFYLQHRPDPVEENYYAAQVFANAPDKRFIVRTNYDRSIPIEETLKLAKTPQEKANIWLLHGVRITGKGLPYITNIYANDPMAQGFGFMLLREMNKLEDWILTPQYSLFEPSTRSDYWENNNAQRILERVKTDRKYAKELLDFVNTVDVLKTDNPGLVLLAKAYIAFLAKEDTQAVAALRSAENAIGKDDILVKPLQLVKGMVLTAAQPNGKAVIPDAVKPILLEQFKKGNHKYIFGIGRELEEKGNSTLAALLFSKSVDQKEIYDEESWLQTVHWKAKNNVTTLYSDYYWEYLTYMDADYTIPQMHALIDDVNAFKGKDDFEKWLYSEAAGDVHELYGLLGTKYFREGKFTEARDMYAKISPKDDYSYEGNIFFKLLSTPEFTANYNKKQKVTRAYIVDNLIKVLGKADNATEKDRDYYYFLAGNCYYNISYYGSAWDMTRRFRTSSYIKNTGLPDDADFFGVRTAMKYYTLAYNNAKTPQFKALCLRMMMQCEDHRLHYEHDINWSYNYSDEIKIGANKYDAQLKKEYGNYYEDLKSNCTAFKDHFMARR